MPRVEQLVGGAAVAFEQLVGGAVAGAAVAFEMESADMSIGAPNLQSHVEAKILPTRDDLSDLARSIELVEIYRLVQ